MVELERRGFHKWLHRHPYEFFVLCMLFFIVARLFGIGWDWYVGVQLAQEAQPFVAHPENPIKRILIVGDSTAVGTGATTPEESVAGRISEEFPRYEIVNYGKNGLQTSELRERLELLQEREFDLVFLFIGGNDIVRFHDVTTLSEDLATSFQLAKQISDDVVFVSVGNIEIAPFFPKPIAYFYRDYQQEVRTAFSIISNEYDVLFVDLFTEGIEDIPLPSELIFAEDDFHPSSVAYAVWYQVIKDTMSIAGMRL